MGRASSRRGLRRCLLLPDDGDGLMAMGVNVRESFAPSQLMVRGAPLFAVKGWGRVCAKWPKRGLDDRWLAPALTAFLLKTKRITDSLLRRGDCRLQSRRRVMSSHVEPTISSREEIEKTYPR